jgi:hypothetical protein
MISTVSVNADVNLTNWVSQTKTECQTSVAESKKNVIQANYPIGTVYKTFDSSITEEDLSETLGGVWQPIESKFLWATDNSGTSELNTIQGQGGKSNYFLSAGIAIGTNNMLGFWTTDVSKYTGNSTTIDLEGNAVNATASDFFNPIKVIDSEKGMNLQTYSIDGEDVEVLEDTVDFRPPFTIVKMFEKIAESESDIEEVSG